MEASQVTGLRAGPMAPVWRMLGDEQLARAAGAGNDHAFAALYARYRPVLRSYCASILLDASDADDAVQAAMIKAMGALPSRDGRGPLRAWLYRIAHNEAIDVLRRRRAHATASEETVEATLVPGPEDDVARRERLAELVADLRALPERQSAALLMRELSGLEYDEIASALELTPGGARQAVFEARSALHDFDRGRAVACATIQRSLSDGDRRRHRARGVRAHLRMCGDCRSFESAIADRGEQLALLPPFVFQGATTVALAGGLLSGLVGTAGGGAAGAPAVGVLASMAGATAAKTLAGAAAVVAVGGAALGTGLADKTPRVTRHHQARPAAAATAVGAPTPLAVASRAPRRVELRRPTAAGKRSGAATSAGAQVGAAPQRALVVVRRVHVDVSHAVGAVAAPFAVPEPPPAVSTQVTHTQQAVARVQTAARDAVAQAVRTAQQVQAAAAHAVSQAVSAPASPAPAPPPSTQVLAQAQQTVGQTVAGVQQLVGALLKRR